MIAFDIDEVVVKFMEALGARLREKGYEIANNNSYEIETIPALPRKAIAIEIFETVRDHRKMNFYPGAVDVLKLVRNITRKPIMFVTSRPKSTAHRTHMLLDRFIKHIPYFVCFANGDRTKLDFLDGIGSFVEDRRKTAIEIASTGRIVFLVDRPWNQGAVHTNIVRIGNIEDLLEMFYEKNKAA